MQYTDKKATTTVPYLLLVLGCWVWLTHL